MSDGWKQGSGVDQKKAEAAARGATKAPEFATQIWKALKGAVGSSAEAKAKEDMKKPESERESTF